MSDESERNGDSEDAPNATWDFPGWGTARRLTGVAPEPPARDTTQARNALGAWLATAICGNDITSSCLYVSALCAAQAGPYAPIVLAAVAGVLYLFRGVYAEVGGALPLNGGTYTVLLNTTNKRMAAAAAVLTLLSYVATAVISAYEAMHYAHNLWPVLDVYLATIGLLGFFAVLNLVGITESARVALVIFVFHMATLTLLAVACGVAIVRYPQLLASNWAQPPPGGMVHALIFGFSAAMLGISGFESSANFIEEQKPGVFPKTLRNMWLAVAIFNPLISFLSLGLLPLSEISQAPPDLLARMGERALGDWLRIWVGVDAVLVLSGAVLTSYVGVTGLMRRMTLDRCLPQFLLAQNRLRGTNHYIIGGFFLVCCSILTATHGDVAVLAGVYTISFLCVMTLFGIGNMLLKVRRGRLPRDTRAGWPTVTLAVCAVLTGLVGNLLMDPENIRVFAVYFLSASAVVGIMFLRVDLMRIALFVSEAVVDRVTRVNDAVRVRVRRGIVEINRRGVVYFTKGDDDAALNRAALYVLQNEQTDHLTVVHVYAPGEEAPAELARHLSLIDRLYPQLRIDFLAVEGTFSPGLIEALSKRLDVPKNNMFIGTPGDRFPHKIQHLGGVRVIL
ncbi:MAG: APC family permease [Myxococcales bacterium]|jgi:amino acid transporter